MFVTRTRTALMAGAATLSLTVGTWASEYSNVIVFGDRLMDVGQYVDYTQVFEEPEDVLGDGRGRFTNREPSGNIGNPWAAQVSLTLGHGPTLPSQPQVLAGNDPLPRGLNFAAGFHNSTEILNSITGTSVLGGIVYRNGATGQQATVPGNSRPGLLNSPDGVAALQNAIVLMNGGADDVYSSANIEIDLEGTIQLGESSLVDTTLAQTIGGDAARNVVSGATTLRDQGAGLVVVSNLINMGALPDATSDVATAARALALLQSDLANDPTLATDPGFNSSVSALQSIIDDPTLISSLRSAGTDRYNEVLSASLSGQDDILIVDQHALFDDMIANPARFGFSTEFDQTTSCLFDSVLYPCENVDTAVNPDTVIFNDGRDVSLATHTMFAQQAASVINAPVQVSGTPFMAIASGRAVANTGTGQISAERVAQSGWAPFVSTGIGQSNWNPVSGEGQQGALPITGVAGVTYSFGNGISVGAAGAYQGISSAKSEHSTGYNGDAIHGTVFAGADFGLVFGTASATLGSVDFDRVERRTNIGSATITNGGSTESDVFGASAEIGVRALTSGTIAAGPIASVDHWSADVQAFDEDGERYTAVNYEGFDGSSTRASLGMFLEAGDISDEDMPVVFRIKALYTREFETDAVEVTGRAASSPTNSYTREGRSPVEDSITVGAQLTYNFGPVIGSLGYDARIGESDDHYGRLDISVPINGAIR